MHLGRLIVENQRNARTIAIFVKGWGSGVTLQNYKDALKNTEDAEIKAVLKLFFNELIKPKLEDIYNKSSNIKRVYIIWDGDEYDSEGKLFTWVLPYICEFFHSKNQRIDVVLSAVKEMKHKEPNELTNKIKELKIDELYTHTKEHVNKFHYSYINKNKTDEYTAKIGYGGWGSFVVNESFHNGEMAKALGTEMEINDDVEKHVLVLGLAPTCVNELVAGGWDVKLENIINIKFNRTTKGMIQYPASETIFRDVRVVDVNSMKLALLFKPLITSCKQAYEDVLKKDWTDLIPFMNERIQLLQTRFQERLTRIGQDGSSPSSVSVEKRLQELGDDKVTDIINYAGSFVKHKPTRRHNTHNRHNTRLRRRNTHLRRRNTRFRRRNTRTTRRR